MNGCLRIIWIQMGTQYAVFWSRDTKEGATGGLMTRRTLAGPSVFHDRLLLSYLFGLKEDTVSGCICYDA